MACSPRQFVASTPSVVRKVDRACEALDARDLDASGRAAAVADIGERLDLLLERPQGGRS